MKGLLLSIAALIYLLPATAQRDTVKQLKTFEVQSRKPLVTRKADRYIVNIENSELSTGLNGLEVLQKSPGLWVSPEGKIQITGGQGVMVMVNDVVQRMSGAELADFLRSLRSEDILKIEVLPNPPAEYEAASAGGIVHIVLKRGRQQGISGNLGVQYRQQDDQPLYSVGGSIDYKMKHWYAFGSYNVVRDRSRYKGSVDTDYPDGTHFASSNSRVNNNTRQQYRGGLVFDFSDNQSVTVQHNGNANRFVQDFYANILYDDITGASHTAWRRRPTMNSTTATYVWNIDSLGSSFKVIADYARQEKAETNTLHSEYSDAAKSGGLRTTTPGNTEIISTQADYTKALNTKSLVRTGAKYVRTNRENSILAEDAIGDGWIKDDGRSNEFAYREDLLMFYGTYEMAVRNTSIKGGLRGEQTYASGHSITTGQTIRRQYFGLFPSVFINHTMDDNSLHLNYSRRVGRPAFNDLNPYRLQINDFEILTGNPDLQPQYTHNVQAGYAWKNSFTADVYFKYTRDYIAQTATTLPDNIIEYKSKNYPGAKEWGLSVDAPITISPNVRLSNGLILYHNTADFDTYKISRTAISLKLMQSVKWPKVADFDMYTEFSSRYRSENSLQYAVFFTDIGATRMFWKGKLRLRVAATDIFNTFREKTLTEYAGTRILFYQKRPTRTGTATLVWNFSAGKTFAKKKIDANNTEEKGRM
ncbi:outer membrane beta-barrel family protein [Chitinophaga sedimenti]|uniref:outer membrane beta-barrel family protein n=1 Tax=Chitinophaga sedimenti TaxID=2033606 RepID=UPI00200442A2|nr:outer membrane beta-barrel family protein [Chitinophaga sedimenti]MCK7554888.1 outer membrane beta-barrel family protein [Chitinophaga sedimenti]